MEFLVLTSASCMTSVAAWAAGAAAARAKIETAAAEATVACASQNNQTFNPGLPVCERA